ncbi:MAG: MATE family efflux transporter, partial [Megasphaera micronuciformis]|nr:MATE family efflux transporter [Megasphaera micronuciformis]
MIRPEGKQITHFFGVFFPLLLTQFALVGSSLFSSIFSGNAGTTDLAGVAVAANIWYPLFAGACGIAFGISPIIAQLRGARKTEDIPVFITQGIYTSFFLTVIIVCGSRFLLTPFLSLLNLDPAVQAIAEHYWLALSFGIFPMLVQATLRYAVDAHGMTRLSMGVLLSNL